MAGQLALKSRNLEFDSRQGEEVIAFFKNILNGCGVHANSYPVAIEALWSKKWHLKRNIPRDAHLLNELLETDVP